MMHDFHVGQKVVCVDDDPHNEWPCNSLSMKTAMIGIRRGEIYTVASIAENRGTSVLSLAHSDNQGEGYSAVRFKPLEEKPDAIEVFREIARDVTAGKVRKLVGV